MEFDPTMILLLLAYASLALELLVFPVPSEASTYQLLLSAQGEGEGESGNGGAGCTGALAAARGRSTVAKLLRYFLPTALCVLLFLVPLVAVFWPEIIGYLWPISVLEVDAMLWAGLVVMVLGRAMSLAAALHLHRHRRRKTGELRLRPTGLFRLSRNPVLLGMYAFYLGTCCIFPCVVLFVGFLPYTLNMHQRVLMEESHLESRLGADYRRYRESVPRYLLF